MRNYRVEYYETAQGISPLAEFLNSTNHKLAVKINGEIALLEEFGPQLRKPYSKYLAEGLFELRAIHATSIARVPYFFEPDRRIVLTHGFIKKQRKTPSAEIDRAIRYRTDWERRHR